MNHENFGGSLRNDDGFFVLYFNYSGICADLYVIVKIFVSGLKQFLSVLDRDYISAQNFVNFGSASF